MTGHLARISLLAAVGCGGADERPCALAEPGRHWLAEGELLTVQLSCSSGIELGAQLVEFVGLPAGASYDESLGVVSWTPALDQAAVYEIGIDLLETGEHSQLLVSVADAYHDPNNVLVTDPSLYPEEYGLPVFFVDSAPTESIYVDASVRYAGEHYDIEAKLRGASSLSYPKNSYTLKFKNDARLDAPALGIGFVDRKKVVLTSTFDDNSYLRQRLAFELWNLMDAEHVQVQPSNAVVYINGQYQGLYAVTDHVDRHLLAGLGFLETGHLYKAYSNQADFRLQDPLHAGVEKKEGIPEDDFSDLWQLITFVDTASDDEFREGIGRVLDVRDYRDWWVFITIIGADDSAGKNSYHYIERPGAPARYVPWDFNHSFGQNWRTIRRGSDVMRPYASRNRIFERLLADPEQASLMKSRVQEMLDGVFHPDNVDALIDTYVEQIADSARRDFAKWEPEYRIFGRWSTRQDFTNFDEEVAYVRTWYRARVAAIQNGAEEAPPADTAADTADASTDDLGSGSSNDQPEREPPVPPAG